MADEIDDKVYELSDTFNSCGENLLDEIGMKKNKSWLHMLTQLKDIIAEKHSKRKQQLLELLYKDLSCVKTESSEDFQGTEFGTYIKYVILLLFSSLENSRFCKRVKKLLLASAAYNEALVETLLSQYIEEILSTGDKPSLSTAEKVYYILDELDIGQKCIEDKLETLLKFLAFSLRQAEIKTKTDDRTQTDGTIEDVLTISIKCLLFNQQIFIKIVQLFSNAISGMLFCERCKSWSGNAATDLCPHKVLENVVLYILENLFTKEIISKEICLLCGLVFGLLTNIVAEKTSSTIHTIERLLYIEDSTKGLNIDKNPATDIESIIELGFLRVNVAPLPPSPLCQISVLQGLLKCGSRSLLMSRHSVSGQDNQVCLLERLLFEVLHYHCRHPNSPVVQYVAFQALKQWLQCVKQMLPNLLKLEKDHNVFCGDSCAVASKLLCLVWDNHEHPVEGVPELVKSVFQLTLELHQSEAIAKGLREDKFYERQAEEILKLPWHVKGRYCLLPSVIPLVDQDKILELNPSLPEELARSLCSNQLASASTDCYRLFISQRPEVAGIDSTYNSLHDVWMMVFIEALCSKDRLQRLNAVQYWLPCTLKSVPKIFKSLMSRLEDIRSDNSGAAWCSLHAKLVTLKTARMLHIIRTDELEEHLALLCEGVCHAQDEVRSAVLGVISGCPRTAEGLSELEIRLLHRYLPNNMNIASPLFRQEMFAALKRTVARLRDSCLGVMKKCGFLEECGERRRCFEKDQLPAEFKKALELVGWLFNFAVENLFPGACYQRQKSGVQLFAVLLETMATSTTHVRRRKGHPPVWLPSLEKTRLNPSLNDTLQKIVLTNIILRMEIPVSFDRKEEFKIRKHKYYILNTFFCDFVETKAADWKDVLETSQLLVALARDWGFWDMFSTRNASVLCGCIESAHNDVRELARELLEKYFPWSFLGVNPSSDMMTAESLMRRTLRMLTSPKAPETESGAAMCHVIFTKYVLELGFNVKLNWKHDLSDERTKAMENTYNEFSDDSGVAFLQNLVQELKRHVSSAKSNLVEAASKTPIHGLLLALTRCFVVVLDRINSRDHGLRGSFVLEFRSLFREVVFEANNIVHFMLDILSGGNEPSVKTVGGASFADMGEAIDELVLDSLPLNVPETISSQSQRDLILSCCWITIKGAYSLLGTAVEKAAFQETDDRSEEFGFLSLSELQDVGESFMAALIHCRHRGIVEGCKPSFVRVCKRLLSSSTPSVRDLPRQWLEVVLSTVSVENTRTSSITRRSAGLPLLVACVLGCEPHSVPDRPLLSYCMGILFTVSSNPVKESIDQTTDLPQVHGMNIMKILYQDAPLGTHMLQYAGDGLVLAITGFASPSWAIRNASTQLFGSVVTRLFGHKMGSDSEEENRTISVRDLFHHYPALEGFFLQKLQTDPQPKVEMEQSEDIARVFLKPELFPILTVLSKLRPSSSDLPNSLLSDFIPRLTSLASSSVFAVREVAAKALVPFVGINNLVGKSVEILKGLQVSQKLCLQNVLHGTLCQVKALLAAAQFYNSQESLKVVEEELRNRLWVASYLNPCSLTRAQFLGIVIDYTPSLISESSLTSEIQTFVRAACTVGPNNPTAQFYSFQVGNVLLNRELSRASLRFAANTRRLQGEESWKEYLHVTTNLLSSANSECRLEALNGLLSFIRREQYEFVTQSIYRQLIDMLPKENDHSCLLGILYILSEKDTCYFGDLSFESIRTLWAKLACLSCGEHGIPVAAYAVSSCSKVLNYCLKIREQGDVDGEWLCAALRQWCNVVDKHSKPERDEQQRRSAVQALKVVGISVLQMAVYLEDNDSSTGDIAAKASQTVFLAAVRLLEDEDEDVRSGAAEFVSRIRDIWPAGEIFDSLNCASSLNILLEFMTHALWRSPEIWVAMETIIRGCTDLPTALNEFCNARCLLYEQDINQYAEPVIAAQITGRMLKIVTSKMFALNTENEKIRENYVHWLTLSFNRLCGDLQVIANSGLKDLGSFQSPKPFILVFRTVCMADVLTHAYIVATTRNIDQRKEIAEHYREMQNLMSEIVCNLEKSIELCHPLLHDVLQSVTKSGYLSLHQQAETDYLSEKLQELDSS